MIEKNALFYMANLHPEIGRMLDFYEQGKLEASQNAQNRALNIVEHILNSGEVKPAGREEWNVIKNFILSLEKLDPFEKKILSRYAEPFSYKFINSYQQEVY